ncbi:MAG: hypothetical protein HY554_14060 [Elusimicrobia bacterium]|nr:hypothetical protein [Elusimicrobiota bacterium]
MPSEDPSRVVFYDPDYPSSWVHSPDLVAATLARRHGFAPLDARQLAGWMERQASAGTAPRTVCVLAQGIAPDTIAERPSPSCTVRRYLDAGGRVVWIGDIPFYYQGRPGGEKKDWGDKGHSGVLGLAHRWQAQGAATLTEEGRRWGLILPDEGVRCVPAKEVTPLTLAGEPPLLAPSWRKAYHPAHPTQGFVRYRGASFVGQNWNARLNELCRVAVRDLEEPWQPPRSWRDPDLERVDRVVLLDARYPGAWSAQVPESAGRLAERHGFKTLDADALARWLRARVAGAAAGSVCVLLNGIAPDAVVDRIGPDCLARRYLDAGGRLVWAGDVPFFYVGRRDGGRSEPGEGGHEAVLDIPIRWDWEAAAPPAITATGKTWGLRSPDEALRGADAALVTEVLAGSGPIATTWLRTYAPAVPGSGFLRFRGGPFDGQADELAAVALHALPLPRKAAPREAPAREAAAGERIGGGTFLVDRRRALQKLMRFVLPEPDLFILPLARAAAAGGATRLSIRRAAGALRIEFDGQELDAAFVDDPFGALVSTEAPPGRRALALGLLTSLSAGRAAVLGSPAGGRRFTSGETSEPAAPASALNQVSIESPLRGVSPRGLARLLRERAPGLTLRLEDVACAEAGAGAEGALALPFEAGPLRGLVRVPEALSVASTLEACVHGVGAGPATVVLPGLQVEGWLNDDSLTLSLSQTSVVRDNRFNDLAQAVAPHAERLALRAASLLRRSRARRERRLRLPGFAELWAAAVARGGVGALRAGFASAAARTAAAVAGDEAASAELAREAKAARWLRHGARRLLRSLEGDVGDPLRRALWKTPLLITADGHAVSLEAIERSRRADGAVRVSRSLRPGWLAPSLIVWLEGPGEAALLRAVFGDAVRDAGAERPRARRKAPAGAALLQRAGVEDLLTHAPFSTGGRAGEIALRLAPPRGGGRIYSVPGAKPRTFLNVPGPLRFEAAVDGPLGPAAAGDALAAADGLYRGLATSLSCPVAFGWDRILGGVKRLLGASRAAAREAAVLGHLRDYLQVATKEPQAGRTWIESVPLFEAPTGWLSLACLRDRLDVEGFLLASDQWDASAATLEPPVLSKTEETRRLLRDLFPGLASERRGSVEVFYRPPPKPACAHPAPFGCLAEGELEGRRVHLAVGADGAPLAYPVPSGPATRLTAAAAGGLGALAAAAALLRAPKAVESGDHPWRRFVLAAAREALAPWPGKPGAGLLRILFATSPLLREPGSGTRPLDVLRRLKSCWMVYQPPSEKKEEAGALVLDAQELALLRALWPVEGKLLVTRREAVSLERRLAGRPLTREALLARDGAEATERPGPRIDDPIEGAKAALSLLAVRQGLALFWKDAERIRAEAGKGRRALSHPDESAWTLDTAHPLVRGILDAGLPPEEQAAFLASVMHTAANRLMPGIADADDATFQEGLLAWSLGDAESG